MIQPTTSHLSKNVAAACFVLLSSIQPSRRNQAIITATCTKRGFPFPARVLLASTHFNAAPRSNNSRTAAVAVSTTLPHVASLYTVSRKDVQPEKPCK
jgi:hypothetical protein